MESVDGVSESAVAWGAPGQSIEALDLLRPSMRQLDEGPFLWSRTGGVASVAITSEDSGFRVSKRRVYEELAESSDPTEGLNDLPNGTSPRELLRVGKVRGIRAVSSDAAVGGGFSAESMTGSEGGAKGSSPGATDKEGVAVRGFLSAWAAMSLKGTAWAALAVPA